MPYQVRDWNKYFENERSRSVDQCSFVCVPNKQHGMGFSYIMAEKDGASIYGIWAMILGACSQQRRPRNGWLTSDGGESGEAWGFDDLAIKFRRTDSEIKRAIDFLSSPKVGWIIEVKLMPNSYLYNNPRPTHDQPTTCHPEWKEGTEGMKEQKESSSLAYSTLKHSIESIYGKGRRWSNFEEQTLFEICKHPSATFEMGVISSYRAALPPKDLPFFPKSVESLLTNWTKMLDSAETFNKLNSPQTGRKRTAEEQAALEAHNKQTEGKI